MASFFIYMLKWALSLTLLYSLYGLFLRKETFHLFNRMVLVGIMLTSMVLPFCTIRTKQETVVSKQMTEIEENISNEIVIWSQPEEEVAEVSQGLTSSEAEELPRTLHLNLTRWLIIIYVLGLVYFWALYLLSLLSIYRVIGRSRRMERDGLPKGIRLMANSSIRMPFCWFGTIVIRETDTDDGGVDAIIAHELAHGRLRHSWDNLLTDLTTNMLWWLPFAWMLRRDLRDVHEYQADQAVMDKGFDVKAYQHLLVERATDPAPYEIVNNFERNPIKRRLLMMFRDPSNKYAWMKALYLIPLAGIALIAFAKPDTMAAIETEVSAEVASFPTPFSSSSDDRTSPTNDNDWMQDPRGIYKMTRITGRGGIEMSAPFDQYKICRDDATISLFVDASNPGDVQFRMNINDDIIFNYTGKVPQEEDGHGSQIYDSNGKEFKLRWWSMHKGHALFPDNDWVVEKYERDKFSKPAEEILNLMKEPPRAKGRDYYAGRWVSMGERESAAEVIALKEGIEAGKKKPDLGELMVMIVRDKRMAMLRLLDGRNMARRGVMGRVMPITHKGKNELRIAGHRFEIHQIDDQFFYIKTEKGDYQLWLRDTYTPNSFYDVFIDMLHADQHQKLSLPTSKLAPKQPDIDLPRSASDSIYIAPNVSIAEYEGGQTVLMQYLQTNLHYPDPIYRKYGFEGRLLVTFVVEKDGSLQHFSVFRNDIRTKETASSLHLTDEEYEAFVSKRKKAFEESVIELLQSMPHWRPAIHETDGKQEYVRMRYTLPFTFKLL